MFDKKGVIALLASVLFLSPISALAEENPINYEEVLEKNLEAISEKYEVGEILSEEDADLIKAYAIASGQNQTPTKSASYSAVKGIASSVESSGNVSTMGLSPQGNLYFNKTELKVAVTGTCSYNFLTLTHKYTCGTAGHSDKIGVTHSLTHDAYALISSGDVLKKHTNTFKRSTSTKKVVSVTASDEYFAATNVWMTFTAKTTSKGHTTTQIRQ